MLDKPEYFWSPLAALRRVFRGMWRASSARQVVTLPWGVNLGININEAIGRQIWRVGAHDLVVTESIWRLLESGQTAVDAGANIGYMTSIMAVRTGPNGHVIAFEPHPDIFEALQENAARWIQPSLASIDLKNSALSNSSGSGILFSPDFFAENEGISCIRHQSLTDTGGVDRAVRLEKLDEVCERADLLKIDVEGHEYCVLQGAEALLSARRVRDILFEDWGLYPTESTEYLKSKGYRVFNLGRTFWGPVIVPAEQKISMRSWESPVFLATTDHERALRLLAPRGWQSIQSR